MSWQRSPGFPHAAAHHFDVLEAAGLIERRVSEGDRRRRYIRLRFEQLNGALGTAIGSAAGGAVRLHPQLGTLPVRGRRVARADRPGRPECRKPAVRAGPSRRRQGRGRGRLRSRPDARPRATTRSRSTRPRCVGLRPRPRSRVPVRGAGGPLVDPGSRPGRDDRGLPPGVRRHRRRGSIGSPRQALDRRHLHDNEDPSVTCDLAELTPAERVSLRHSATALERRWKGKMNVETIERFMAESLEIILPGARVRTWVPVLVERLTNDRLRALVRLESDRTDLSPSVLFLCVHNAGRSQMAAGWMRHLAGERVDVFSGGSEPASELNAGGGRRDGGEGHRHRPRAPPAVGRRDRPRGRRDRDDGLWRRLPGLPRQALRRLGARRPSRPDPSRRCGPSATTSSSASASSWANSGSSRSRAADAARGLLRRPR